MWLFGMRLLRWRHRWTSYKFYAISVFLFVCIVIPSPQTHKMLLNIRDNLSIKTPGVIVDLSEVRSFQSTATHKTVIIRIFGNNLFPLQQKDQGVKNLQFILNHETFHHETSAYLWVVNRVLNSTESDGIRHLLGDQHVFDIDFDLGHLKELLAKDTRAAVRYATDINHARNEALRYAALNIDADWLILLDGNTFLTDEAYQLLMEELIKAENNQQYLYFIPMYRLYHDQTILASNSRLDSLRDHISGLQEPYLAIHRNALRMFRRKGVDLFDTSVVYGARSKISSLEMLSKFYPSHIGCHSAYHESSVRKITYPTEQGTLLGSHCSYIIRLLYWPTGFSSSVRSEYTFLTKLAILRAYLFDSNAFAENNNFVRSRVRQDSIQQLLTTIGQLTN